MRTPQGGDAMSKHEHHHDHTDPPSDLTLRVKALESLLTEKGLVDFGRGELVPYPALIEEVS